MEKALEPVIGLEIHVQLTTKSKMFCSCANIFGDVPPNSAICPICMGYPGTLPVPNKTAIEWTRKAGAALGCELALKSKFDRKSYFYPDLPKGYQISQYDQPFCIKGSLKIVTPEGERTIGITRIHLEEDAAKNTHPSTRPGGSKDPEQSETLSLTKGEPVEGPRSGQAPYTLIDFNRAGTPLMEIVTEPDIRTPAEAKLFLQELQRIMRALKISDADMEKGQLRCDANISLREEKEKGSGALNPKTEIKNLNSFRNVERALQYEIKRQQAAWEEGAIPHNATRGWDATAQRTVEQRTKEEAADYRYFPEPDIPPFVFSVKDTENIFRGLPELPAARRERFKQEYNIDAEQAELLVDLPILATMFEETASELSEIDQERDDVKEQDIPGLLRLAANVTLRQLRELIEEHDLSATILKISPENFAELVVLLYQQKINKSALPQLLTEMQRTGGDPDPIIQNLGLAQMSGEGDLEKHVQEVVAENPEIVAKIKAGKDSAIQFLMGQVMAKTAGKANPKVITDLLKKNIG